MGILKKILGGAKIVAGIATANPALAIGGGTEIAGDILKKRGGGTRGSKSQATAPQIAAAPHIPATLPPITPPMSAGSLDEARAQDKARMKRSYGI